MTGPFYALASMLRKVTAAGVVFVSALSEPSPQDLTRPSTRAERVYQGRAPDGRTDGALPDQRYLRCAPGRTNPLYPPQPDSEQPGESCAPTLDDFPYESVSLDPRAARSQRP